MAVTDAMAARIKESEARRTEEIRGQYRALLLEAQMLGRDLTNLRAEKWSSEQYGKINTACIADPEIDVLEIRYRRAVDALEKYETEKVRPK